MLKREGRNGEKKATFNEGFTSKSKGHFNFDLGEEDFEDFKCGHPTEHSIRHAEVYEVVF